MVLGGEMMGTMIQADIILRAGWIDGVRCFKTGGMCVLQRVADACDSDDLPDDDFDE